jgi:hypothetical protein
MKKRMGERSPRRYLNLRPPTEKSRQRRRGKGREGKGRKDAGWEGRREGENNKSGWIRGTNSKNKRVTK